MDQNQLCMLAAMLASGTNHSAKDAVDKAEAIIAEVAKRAAAATQAKPEVTRA